MLPGQVCCYFFPQFTCKIFSLDNEKQVVNVDGGNWACIVAVLSTHSLPTLSFIEDMKKNFLLAKNSDIKFIFQFQSFLCA
jgi:hypothetical protein